MKCSVTFDRELALRLLNTAAAWVPTSALASQSNIEEAFNALKDQGIKRDPQAPNQFCLLDGTRGSRN